MAEQDVYGMKNVVSLPTSKNKKFRFTGTMENVQTPPQTSLNVNYKDNNVHTAVDSTLESRFSLNMTIMTQDSHKKGHPHKNNLKRCETGHNAYAEQAADLSLGEKTKAHLKHGYSVGPSARTQVNAKGSNDIPIVSSDRHRRKPKGADVGNGYTLGYKQLVSLSKLRKVGVNIDALFAEPKEQPPDTWTLGRQIDVMEQRRTKTLRERIEEKNKKQLQANSSMNAANESPKYPPKRSLPPLKRKAVNQTLDQTNTLEAASDIAGAGSLVARFAGDSIEKAGLNDSLLQIVDQMPIDEDEYGNGTDNIIYRLMRRGSELMRSQQRPDKQQSMKATFSFGVGKSFIQGPQITHSSTDAHQRHSSTGAFEKIVRVSSRQEPSSLFPLNNKSVVAPSETRVRISTQDVFGTTRTRGGLSDGKRQVKSLAALSTTKMYKQAFLDGSSDQEEFTPCLDNFKMPSLKEESKPICQQVERLRSVRSKNAQLIEERLRTYTKNSNIHTTERYPQPSAPEKRYRDYVSNTVDMMSRCSIKGLKAQIDKQKEMEFRKAMLLHQQQIKMAVESSQNAPINTSQNNLSTVTLPNQLRSSHQGGSSDVQQHLKAANVDVEAVHDAIGAQLLTYTSSDIVKEVQQRGAIQNEQIVDSQLLTTMGNLHTVLEWNKEQGLYVLPLQDYNRNEGGVLLTDESILRVLKSIGRSLKTLHRNRQVHGKVTPEHIMVDPQGKVFLKMQERASLEEGPPSEGHLTLVDALFNPPEGQQGTPEKDMYQLGVSLKCMLFGRPDKERSDSIASQSSRSDSSECSEPDSDEGSVSRRSRRSKHSARSKGSKKRGQGVSGKKRKTHMESIDTAMMKGSRGNHINNSKHKANVSSLREDTQKFTFDGELTNSHNQRQDVDCLDQTGAFGNKELQSVSQRAMGQSQAEEQRKADTSLLKNMPNVEALQTVNHMYDTFSGRQNEYQVDSGPIGAHAIVLSGRPESSVVTTLRQVYEQREVNQDLLQIARRLCRRNPASRFTARKLLRMKVLRRLKD